MKDLYAVIFAGGVGSRLWPVSRASKPKQIQPFLETEETLIQRTFRRVRRLLPPENIYVSTTADYAEHMKDQLPELVADRLIVEPQLRNTCPAMGLATSIVAKRHPGAFMVNIWADHHYSKEDNYVATLEQLFNIARNHPEKIMAVGLNVEYPNTALGYLEVDEKVPPTEGAFRVKRFVEKPDLKRAEKFMRAGNYYWNVAMFMWQAEHMLSLYQELVPGIYEGLKKIQADWDTPKMESTLKEVYPKLTKIAVEYAIFEKGPEMLLLPASLGWRDIGSWQSVFDVMNGDSSDKVATKGKAVVVDSKDVLVFNEDKDRLITVVGLDDVAVVNTPDALLVIKKSKDQDVKKLVEKIEAEKMTQYL